MHSFVPQIAYEGEGTAGAAPAPAPAPAAPWHGGDAELTGYLQNRGWVDKPVGDVAKLAITAHREAERLIGAPANQMLRLPANMGDDKAMAPVWTRLGKPAEAKDYDLSNVKLAGDKPLDAPLADAIKAAMFDGNVPKDAASRIAAGIAKHLDGSASDAAAMAAVKLQEEKAALDKNWGANKEANAALAKRAAMKLGIEQEAVIALEKVVGYSKVMEMFRSLGERLGEAPLIGGGDGHGGAGIRTREQAMARKAELMADREWTAKYLGGGSRENREMTELNTIIVGN